LLESVYEQCLCHELRAAAMAFERQVAIPIIYKAVPIGELPQSARLGDVLRKVRTGVSMM
jgi:GxxExxY protein